MLIQSGESTQGNSGGINASTPSVQDKTGSISIMTGNAADGNSGHISLGAGKSLQNSSGSVLVLAGRGFKSRGSILSYAGSSDKVYGRSGNVQIQGGSGRTGGQVSVRAGFGDENKGGELNLLSGISASNASGNIILATGDSTVHGNSGPLSISTGMAESNTGHISVFAGEADIGMAHGISIRVGETNANNGENIGIGSGNSSTYRGGEIRFQSGKGYSGSGHVLFETESTEGSAKTGSALLISGNADKGDSGSIYLSTGTSREGMPGNISVISKEGTSLTGSGVYVSGGVSGGQSGGTIYMKGGSASESQQGAGGKYDIRWQWTIARW